MKILTVLLQSARLINCAAGTIHPWQRLMHNERPRIINIVGGSMRISLLIVTLFLAAGFVSAGEQKGKERTRTSSKAGWLGVGIHDVTPKFAREEELKIKEGAYVNEVVDNSPADSAGLKEGDVIIEFNSTKIETAEDLTDAVRGTKPGTKISIKVNRNGETKSLTATIRKNKMRMPFAMNLPHAPNVVVNMFRGDLEGMDVMDLNKQLAEYFEVPGGKGVLVKSVEKDRSAATSGIKAGDVIVKIGDERVNDIDDLQDVLSDSDEGAQVPVELLRKGKKVTVSLEISEPNDDDGIGYWRHRAPGNFNFHFEPQMEQMQRELKLRMQELPKRHRELQKIQMEMGEKEV